MFDSATFGAPPPHGTEGEAITAPRNVLSSSPRRTIAAMLNCCWYFASMRGNVETYAFQPASYSRGTAVNPRASDARAAFVASAAFSPKPSAIVQFKDVRALGPQFEITAELPLFVCDASERVVSDEGI